MQPRREEVCQTPPTQGHLAHMWYLYEVCLTLGWVLSSMPMCLFQKKGHTEAPG